MESFSGQHDTPCICITRITDTHRSKSESVSVTFIIRIYRTTSEISRWIWDFDFFFFFKMTTSILHLPHNYAVRPPRRAILVSRPMFLGTRNTMKLMKVMYIHPMSHPFWKSNMAPSKLKADCPQFTNVTILETHIFQNRKFNGDL